MLLNKFTETKVTSSVASFDQPTIQIPETLHLLSNDKKQQTINRLKNTNTHKKKQSPSIIKIVIMQFQFCSLPFPHATYL